MASLRSDHELHELSVNVWTPDEAARHLAETFDGAARQFPDLMEPYQIRLEGLDQLERVKLMRRALSETICARYPTPDKRS